MTDNSNKLDQWMMLFKNLKWNWSKRDYCKCSCHFWVCACNVSLCMCWVILLLLLLLLDLKTKKLKTLKLSTYFVNLDCEWHCECEKSDWVVKWVSISVTHVNPRHSLTVSLESWIKVKLSRVGLAHSIINHSMSMRQSLTQSFNKSITVYTETDSVWWATELLSDSVSVIQPFDNDWANLPLSEPGF